MKAKKYLAKIMFLAMAIFAAQSSALCAAEWVNISGTVYYNGQPLCVMVLANGQHIFTDMADGRYNLNVPLDEKGEITLYSFCEGLSPYKKVIKSWESRYNDIYMSPASPGSPDLTITVNQRASEKSGWVKIDGTVSWNGTPMCAMILANGQNMFSCSGNGAYDLEVPWDNDGKITFYSFCEGMLPYKEILYME